MKKTLIHFLYEQGIEHRLPHVYLDMDGVLVNLEKGAYDVHGVKLGDVPKPERWEKIKDTKDFWKNLEWMSGAKSLWKFLKPYEPSIMSAYATHEPNSARGKEDWLNKNVGKLPKAPNTTIKAWENEWKHKNILKKLLEKVIWS